MALIDCQNRFDVKYECLDKLQIAKANSNEPTKLKYLEG